MVAHDIIIRPVLSEKTYADIPNKKYTFEVAKNARRKNCENYNLLARDETIVGTWPFHLDSR